MHWDEGKRQSDIILYNDTLYSTKKLKNIKMCNTVNARIKTANMYVIKTYWDCFSKESAKYTILIYVIGIDNGEPNQFVIINQLMGRVNRNSYDSDCTDIT